MLKVKSTLFLLRRTHLISLKNCFLSHAWIPNNCSCSHVLWKQMINWQLQLKYPSQKVGGSPVCPAREGPAFSSLMWPSRFVWERKPRRHRRSQPTPTPRRIFISKKVSLQSLSLLFYFMFKLHLFILRKAWTTTHMQRSEGYLKEWFFSSTVWALGIELGP